MTKHRMNERMWLSKDVDDTRFLTACVTETTPDGKDAWSYAEITIGGGYGDPQSINFDLDEAKGCKDAQKTLRLLIDTLLEFEEAVIEEVELLPIRKERHKAIVAARKAKQK